MVTTLTLGPMSQIARSVRDVKESESWYRNLLGLPHLYTFGTMAFFDCGGVRLMLSQVEGPLPADSVIYFEVDFIQQVHESLMAKGVDFIDAPHMIHRHPDGTEEWLAFFRDPEGRPLAIHSRV
jgi:catechol 2,3-dioxygenase-like lactoylglutathione lyase family enzyme